MRPPPDDYMTRRWRAQENDLIGGWCVTLEEDRRTPAEGNAPLVDIANRQTAEHIARLHNYWLLMKRGAPSRW